MSNSKNISTLFFSSQVEFLKDSFIINDKALFSKFSEAVQKFCFFIFEIDKLIDGDYQFENLYSKEHNVLYNLTKNHQESIKLLLDIFPKEHPFWEDLDQTNFRYYQILLKEKQFNKTRERISNVDFEDYADAKHALAYIPIRGMKYLFESKIETHMLEDLFANIFKAMQMNDDLEDFDADERSGQWTFVHSEVQNFMTENDLDENSNLEKFRERVLYVSGIGEKLTYYAKEKFLSAKNSAEKFQLKNLTLWLDNAVDMMESNQQLISKLTSK
ncbi:hypothetical protein [Chryseobacterium sp. Leaf180]|uniref:hypothetical protein n=1 Tax=Chryseobacterium sp. Leaf180 TaxID=1736289 RepID=UPI000A4EB991|nr:hypothetical protein [Chryseobacterium sp. Leaf180]